MAQPSLDNKCIQGLWSRTFQEQKQKLNEIWDHFLHVKEEAPGGVHSLAEKYNMRGKLRTLPALNARSDFKF